MAVRILGFDVSYEDGPSGQELLSSLTSLVSMLTDMRDSIIALVPSVCLFRGNTALIQSMTSAGLRHAKPFPVERQQVAMRRYVAPDIQSTLATLCCMGSRV